jgi:hypothetical protein
LDLAFTFPADYRVAYERATWADVLTTVQQARQQTAWAEAQKAAVSLTVKFPTQAGVWYILGAFEEAECHQKNAAAAYAEAQRLMPEGAGEFAGLSSTSDWPCLHE